MGVQKEVCPCEGLFAGGARLAAALSAAGLLVIIAVSVAAQSDTGHIAGIVTDEATGAPLPGMAVTASGIPGDWQQRGAALTAADGTYDVGNLIPGEYWVYFADPRGDHIPEIFDNVASSGSGAYVYVTAGQTTAGINAALAGAGHITGRLTAEATGAPIAGIRASALRWDSAHGACGGGKKRSSARPTASTTSANCRRAAIRSSSGTTPTVTSAKRMMTCPTTAPARP